MLMGAVALPRMSRSALHSPKVALRLTRDDVPALPPGAAAIRDIALENRLASLASDDVRVAFARTVASSIEGGRAALLRPKARQALVANGVKLGLRPFDVSLVIAIMQDAARRGEGVSTLPVQGRLGMVGSAAKARGLWPLAAGVLLGLAMLAVLVWLVAGS